MVEQSAEREGSTRHKEEDGMKGFVEKFSGIDNVALAASYGYAYLDSRKAKAECEAVQAAIDGMESAETARVLEQMTALAGKAPPQWVVKAAVGDELGGSEEYRNLKEALPPAEQKGRDTYAWYMAVKALVDLRTASPQP